MPIYGYFSHFCDISLSNISRFLSLFHSINTCSSWTLSLFYLSRQPQKLSLHHPLLHITLPSLTTPDILFPHDTHSRNHTPFIGICEVYSHLCPNRQINFCCRFTTKTCSIMYVENSSIISCVCNNQIKNDDINSISYTSLYMSQYPHIPLYHYITFLPYSL